MATEDNTVYKYLIPLEENNGVESPAYSAKGNGEVLSRRYTSTEYHIVQTKSTPHFHKDTVNVEVHEVNKEKYTE